MKYFEEKVQAGEWDEVEKYLSGFTKVDDNRYSMKIFFEIRKQKYLEALDRQDKAKAVEILVTDLKVFSTFNEELYKEITQLLTLNNFRCVWLALCITCFNALADRIIKVEGYQELKKINQFG
uniref:CTLH domain-containing protein n=2 Tax=Opuntia streptacantha TaxID=393608 RepID=A0A7C9EJ69_OPUST